MRAAAIKALPRARNWQSQRVTPRSAATTAFHPEPPHSGQTSTAVFIILSLILYLELCTRTGLRRNRKPFPLCAHPVQSGAELWRIAEKQENRCAEFTIQVRRRGFRQCFRLIPRLLPAQPLASVVKTGNWHVFPIDNPRTWARMAIAGARASSSPSPADAREPKMTSVRREHE
jgi:hypothetical protein